MFTAMKIRTDLARDDYRDPGWYKAPKGSVAYLWQGEKPPASREGG
jgi:manganese oxidase